MRYLEQLERAVKQKVGVVPEDVLTDAREFLLKDFRSLQQSEPGMCDDEVFEHFLSTFGPPEEVAQSYEDACQPNLLKLGGVAPNWRICCTKCGRSAPAAKAGITRLGACSREKYVGGWCHDCRRLRWMRLERDLETANLTRELGAGLTGEQLREQKHRPWRVVWMTLAFALALAVVVSLVTRQIAGVRTLIAGDTAPAQVDPVFANMPRGWTVEKKVAVSQQQLPNFSRKLGGAMDSITNTFIRDGGRRLQVNRLTCKTRNDAIAVEKKLLALKTNSRTVCRNGVDVFEFVCRTPEAARFAMEARYRLPIQPDNAKYRIRFDAAPISGGDDMARNQIFNLFLKWHSDQERAKAESELRGMSEDFQLGNELILKRTGLGETKTQWKFTPAPTGQSKSPSGEATRFRFADLPRRGGFPVVGVEAVVSSTTFAPAPVGDSESRADFLRATSHWPVDAEEVARIVHPLVVNMESDQAKVDALLDWFGEADHIRFAGKTGSRYGTLRVLQQKHGHCWDYSDLFITFCRAVGLPARQIFGWIEGGEGHVWAEVAVGQNWQQLDPTTGVGCGSDYLPLVTSSDGKMPMVYASPIKIQRLGSR